MASFFCPSVQVTRMGRDCTTLSRIVFDPNANLKVIPEAALKGNAIESAGIPKTALRLSARSFAKTDRLKSVAFQDGSVCTTIEANAFTATHLDSLSLPGLIQVIPYE
jgi:hypothetical protein